jgi:uncharacterized integral membrane protein
MYCPNCGANNSTEQKFCRSCGFNLEKTVESLLEQKPDSEHAGLQKQKEIFRKIGLFFLLFFSIGTFAFILNEAIKLKVTFWGWDNLISFAILGFAICGMLSIFFFNYHKFAGKKEWNSVALAKEIESKETAKLLEDKPIEPIPSVTEPTTDLLFVENRTKKFE